MDDTARLIVTGVLIGFGACLAFIAGLVQTSITSEVNRKLPEGSRISHLGGHLGKALRVRREYLRLYPRGQLMRRFYLLTALSMIFFASGAAVLFKIVG